MGFSYNNNDPTSNTLRAMFPYCQGTICVNTRAWASSDPEIRQWSCYFGVCWEGRTDIFTARQVFDFIREDLKTFRPERTD